MSKNAGSTDKVSMGHQKNRKKGRWTPEEDEQLRRIAARRLTLAQIEAEMGYSRPLVSISARLARLGLFARPASEVVRARHRAEQKRKAERARHRARRKAEKAAAKAEMAASAADKKAARKAAAAALKAERAAERAARAAKRESDKAKSAGKRRLWTPDEDKRLISLHGKFKSIDKVHEAWGGDRTRSSIAGRAKKLGLRRSHKRKPWTKRDEKILLSLIASEGIQRGCATAARMLERSPHSCDCKYRTLPPPVERNMSRRRLHHTQWDVGTLVDISIMIHCGFSPSLLSNHKNIHLDDIKAGLEALEFEPGGKHHHATLLALHGPQIQGTMRDEG